LFQVAYFPKTVLTGIIGGIGVSLFVLGIGLPFPRSSPGLSLSSAGRMLFAVDHLGLLSASCIPAFFLSLSLRSNLLRRMTLGGTNHAYYVPLFFLFLPIVFWITVASLHKANSKGMTKLVNHGWLFEIGSSAKHESGIGNSWLYWKLFDFTKVEPRAFKSSMTNIVLVVVIGVLNLPIYVPALGLALKVKVNTNHEFIGQGVANILAGVAGTAPNILVGWSVWSGVLCFSQLTLDLPCIATFILDILYSCWWREIWGRNRDGLDFGLLLRCFPGITLRTNRTCIDSRSVSWYRTYVGSCLAVGEDTRLYWVAGDDGDSHRLYLPWLCSRVWCGYWSCYCALPFTGSCRYGQSTTRSLYSHVSNSTSREPPLLNWMKRPNAPDIRRWHTVRVSVPVWPRHPGQALVASISKTRLHLKNLQMLPYQGFPSNNNLQNASVIGMYPRSM